MFLKWKLDYNFIKKTINYANYIWASVLVAHAKLSPIKNKWNTINFDLK